LHGLQLGAHGQPQPTFAGQRQPSPRTQPLMFAVWWSEIASAPAITIVL